MTDYLCWCFLFRAILLTCFASRTWINGYDLTSEYKDLLAYYKDGKFINLQNGQEDETIANDISSVVSDNFIFYSS